MDFATSKKVHFHLFTVYSLRSVKKTGPMLVKTAQWVLCSLAFLYLLSDTYLRHYRFFLIFAVYYKLKNFVRYILFSEMYLFTSTLIKRQVKIYNFLKLSLFLGDLLFMYLFLSFYKMQNL